MLSLTEYAGDILTNGLWDTRNKTLPYPTGRKFSLEFKFRKFANGKFAKLILLLDIILLEISLFDSFF